MAVPPVPDLERAGTHQVHERVQLMAAVTVRPEVQAAVDAWPPLTSAQKARLRRTLHDWPERIEERVRARHPELAADRTSDPAA